jgi:DNA-binding response OmpR family regulator
MRVLVVEDHEELAETVAVGLRREGMAVDVALDGASAGVGYTMVRGDRSVDVFARKLRQKLERISPNRRYVHTHFGVGYRFAAEHADGTPVEPPPAATEITPPQTAAAYA